MKRISIIRGKITGGGATPDEVQLFMRYVDALEELLNEASCDDFFGTEGWEPRVNFIFSQE